MGRVALTAGAIIALASMVFGASCQFLPDSCQLPWEEDLPVEIGAFSWRSSLPGLAVELSPTSETRGYRVYVLDLYERRELRETTTVSWSTSELNGGWIKYAEFVLDRPEDREYRFRSSEDLADIFSVKIRE